MYKVGMKVVVSTQGHEKYGVGSLNPKGVKGEVIAPDDHTPQGWYLVKWPKGETNDYQEGDLVVIADE